MPTGHRAAKREFQHIQPRSFQNLCQTTHVGGNTQQAKIDCATGTGLKFVACERACMHALSEEILACMQRVMTCTHACMEAWSPGVLACMNEIMASWRAGKPCSPGIGYPGTWQPSSCSPGARCGEHHYSLCVQVHSAVLWSTHMRMYTTISVTP